MWRKLTVMLFLLVLAKTASALPIAELFHDNAAIDKIVTQIEQKTVSLDTDEPEVLYNLPRTNGFNASLFNTEIQSTPEYFLVVEFFKIKLTAGLFKNLANPPLITPWYEQLSHSKNSSRLSGWKDGNSLYSSRTIYHS
ncbi:hypothetical protein FGD67_18905 [Colwellia sp. M166]|uniref:hypothetical protein n=1 Tax=Colwellia sp. M166 TaxID=2583805 RepID=UPI00211DBE2C|nr:hypothetical protein [Colwellia sp. M166]UUO25045.1 hypothetical protein FGD67_18905 [Colwellia sp. M166]|tara:strand:- start:8793 stop:9209 length:417 start_codon:yes stop_codon:yes gene_type:complete